MFLKDTLGEKKYLADIEGVEVFSFPSLVVKLKTIQKK